MNLQEITKAYDFSERQLQLPAAEECCAARWQNVLQDVMQM